MYSTPIYQRIAELLDFGDEIANLIGQDEFEDASYFMTLVYIEDILDKYGRGLAVRSARTGGLTEEEISAIRVHLNTGLDALRAKIRHFSQTYNFDEAMRERGQSLLRNWQKL